MTEQPTFFTSAPETFTKIDYMLGPRVRKLEYKKKFDVSKKKKKKTTKYTVKTREFKDLWDL